MTSEDVYRRTDAAFLSLSKSLKEFHYRVGRRSSTTPTTEVSLVTQPLERLGYPLLKRYVYNDNLHDQLIPSPILRFLRAMSTKYLQGIAESM